MPKLKKVHFPSEVGQVTPFVSNADGKLVGGLGAKYGVVAGDMTKSTNFKINIPAAISAAEAATQTAQSLNDTKDTIINDGKLFYKKMGRDFQENSVYDSADMEAMGFYKIIIPPDPNLAKVEVSPTILPDQIIYDWKKQGWGGIMVRTSSDGVRWSDGEKDMRSPWEDTRKNAVPGVPEKRYTKWRHINKEGNEIGQETILTVVVDIE
ncbi:MAG: hypothetical protein ABIT08_14265 [Bacteroidia bacterium]